MVNPADAPNPGETPPVSPDTPALNNPATSDTISASTELTKVGGDKETEDKKAEEFDKVCKVHKEPDSDDDTEYEVLQSLQLPESIYTAAITLPLTELDKQKGWDNWMKIQIVGLLFSNLVVQGMLTAYIYEITIQNGDEYGTCAQIECKLDQDNCIQEQNQERCVWDADNGTCSRDDDYALIPNVRYMCIVIYIGYMLSDLIDSIYMTMWWKRITNWNPNSRRFELVNDDGESDEDVNEVAQTMMNCSWKFKLYVYVCVLLPKYCVTLALLIIGAGFIVNTDSNENLILNALALGFIIELDEMMYEGLLGTRLQQFVSKTPVINIKGTDRDATWTTLAFGRFGITVKLVLLAGFSYASLVYFCPDED